MREALPLLLVPCLAGSPRLYAAQLPMLWQFGAVGIADHRRGETIDAIAQQILATAPPRFALMGLSLGGYIAFELLRQAPERIERLVLIDTSARADSSEQTARRRALIELTRGGGFEQVIDTAYASWVHRSRLEDQALRSSVRAMAHECGAEAFLRQQQAILQRVDSRAMLSSIRCPTLVLVGDEDQLTPLECAQEIAAPIAGSQLEVIRECGHLSTLEQPAAVNQVLQHWLERITR
jgi:pimeloyl-ACP methyl ester carboxylesterase